MDFYKFLRKKKKFLVAFIKDYLFRFVFYFISPPKRDTKYYFSVCCIFKDEARYFREWIEYQKIIGVDHIYAYNNDSTDDYMSVLKSYIDDDYITLVEFPGKYAQFAAYTHCYENFRNETYWLSFVDLDEFIVPHTTTDIKKWIKPYEKYPSIEFYWLMFGTNGVVEYDENKLVIEQYTNSFENIRNTGKIALNTAYQPVKMYHHNISCYLNIFTHKFKVPTIDEHRKFVFFYEDHKVNYKHTIQMNHYWSKCLSEYVRKIDKGAIANKNNEEVRKDLSFFYWHEHQNVREDKVIFRFLAELKIALYGISIAFKK